jgi:hypothetical protein
MIHYTCDMCRRELDRNHEETFVVRMEVYPAGSEANAGIDNDRDHLEDIQEVLERFQEFESNGVLPENDAYQKHRLDLCRGCCERLMREALGRRNAPQFDFSKR